jgi:hypothetical protein
MSKRSLLKIVSGAFFAGALVLTYQLGYSNAQENEAVNYQVVNIETARAFHQSYYTGARTPESAVRSYSINMDQYQAMSQLLGENASLGGFRVYFGKNNRNEDVSMVLGTSGGKDVAASIFLTSPLAAGLCPSICDMSSPMLQTE